jgi:hypothetical protein
VTTNVITKMHGNRKCYESYMYNMVYDVTQCRSVNCQSFKITYRSHLQGSSLGLPIGPVFKGPVFLRHMSLEDGTDT